MSKYIAHFFTDFNIVYIYIYLCPKIFNENQMQNLSSPLNIIFAVMSEKVIFLNFETMFILTRHIQFLVRFLYDMKKCTISTVIFS